MKRLTRRFFLVGSGFAVLLLLGVGAWTFLFYSQTGAQIVVSQFLSWYNAQIPGKVTVHQVSGSFANGVTLNNVTGRTEKERLVLRAKTLAFRLSPGPLWEKRVALDVMTLSDVTMGQADVGLDGGLSDLVIPATAPSDTDAGALLPELPLQLFAPNIYLENIRFQKKNAASPLVDVHVDSLRGALNWHRRLRVTVTALIGDVGISNKRFKYALEDTHQIVLRSDTLHTVLSVETHWGRARISLDSLLEKSLQSALAFRLNIHSLDEALGDLSDLGYVGGTVLPRKLDGVLNGRGHLSFRMTDAQTPVVDATFHSENSTLKSIGEIEVDIDAGLQGNAGTLKLRVEGGGLQVQGAVNGTIRGEGQGTLDFKGTMSSQLLALFGVRASTGKVNGHSTCHFGKRTVCDSTVQLEKVTYEALQASKISADISTTLGGDESRVAGKIAIDTFVASNRTLHRIELSGKTDGADAILTIYVPEHGRQSASAQLRLNFTDGVTANVDSFQSTLFDVQLEALKPFAIRFAGANVKTLSPLVLRLNHSRVTVDHLEKRGASLNGELSFTHLRLEQLSALVGEPLSGELNGTLAVSGNMSNPSVSLNVEATQASLRSFSPGQLAISGKLKNRQLIFGLTGHHNDETFIVLDGRVPVSLDLSRGDLRLLKTKPSRVNWQITQFNDRLLRDWMSLPKGVTFAGKGNGSFSHIDGQMTLAGGISGQFTHPKTGKVTFEANHSLQPDAQHIQLTMTDRNGTPVSMELQSELPIAALLKKEIPKGPLKIKTTIGDDQLEIDARPLDSNRILVDIKVDRFELANIGMYTNTLVLDGVLAGDIKLVWYLDTMSLSPFALSPWRLSLQLVHLNPNTLSGFDVNTGALLFEAGFDGALACDGKTISANGTLDGWLGDGTFIRFPAHLEFDATQTAQALKAEWLMPNGVPAKLDLNGSLDLMSYLNGQFAPHGWQAALRWGDATISLQATIDDLQNAVANIDIDGLTPSLLKPMVIFDDVTGTLSGGVRGKLVDNVLSLGMDLSISDASIYGWEFIEIRTKGTFDSERLKVRLNGRHQYGKDFYVAGEIPLSFDLASWHVDWQAAKAHRLEWKIPSTNVYPIRHLLGVADIFDISIGMEGALSGVPNDFDAATKIFGAVRAPGVLPVTIYGDFQANPSTQHLDLSIAQGQKDSSKLSVALSGNIERLIAGNQRPGDVPLSASLTTPAIDLHFLELFPIPVVSRLGGSAQADLRITGTVGMPRITGKMKLRDGRFSVAGLANRIHGVTGEVRFYGDRLSVPKLQFKSARGAGRFWGQLRLDEAALAGTGTLRLNSFPVAMAGLPRFIIDTESSMAFSTTQKLLDMTVSVRRATFTKPAESRSSTQFIPANDNVTVRDSENDEEDKQNAFDYNIRIQSDQPILVKGRDINTSWDATILANRTAGVASVGGNIDAVGGTFSLFQNTFDIERGELTFAKKPGKGAYLQLESASTISSYTVYLDVSGNLLRPKLRLSSSPVLTDEQILTLLVSGSTEEDAETSTGAVTNLLAVQYPGIHNLLYNRFGISQLRVETTDQGSTALKAGKRVTDRSTVYTVINSNPAKNENDFELQVEVNITDKTSVGTAVGEKSSSIGIYRRFNIPNKKRKIRKLPFRRRNRE